MKKLYVVLTFTFIINNAIISHAANILYFTSSPTSIFSYANSLILTSPTTTFSAYRYSSDEGYSANGVKLWANPYSGYSLAIVGPNNSLPIVGFYSNATRFPFMGSGPGLAFSGNGRGNNTLTGYFNVLEANYDINGNVLSFAVDFMQYDRGVQTDWTSGSFRYNSNIPINEPTTIALLALSGLVLRKNTKIKIKHL